MKIIARIYDIMLKQGIILDKYGIDLIMRKLDINKDNNVDFDDFKQFLMCFKNDRNVQTNMIFSKEYSNTLYTTNSKFYTVEYSFSNNTSYEEKNIVRSTFLNYITCIKEFETEIEDYKGKLTNNAEFQYPDLLLIFMKESSDKISKESFKKGLGMFGVYENISIFDLFLKRYGKILKRDYLS